MKPISSEERQAAPAGPTPTIFEAIVRQRCISATYNRTRFLLAPHIIYTRHGDLFIDAVPIERDGQPPREEKLGTFKLVGLGDLAITQRGFEASNLFNAGDAKYAGAALMAVEPDAIAA